MLCGCGTQKSIARSIDRNFLEEPVRLTLPGYPSDLAIEYVDGVWVSPGVVDNKEVKRLKLENERLQRENNELQLKLTKAINMAAVLKCDLQKIITTNKNIRVECESKEQLRNWLSEDNI